MPHVRPGDLLCTRNATGLGGRLIRLGAALRDEHSHVGLASPVPDRTCSPADWAAFILERAWL